MKTKFDITDEIFMSDHTLYEMFRIAELEYGKYGFIIDKAKQEVYKIFDKEIILNEGDRINLHGFRIVTWKCYHPELDMYEYILKEE